LNALFFSKKIYTYSVVHMYMYWKKNWKWMKVNKRPLFTSFLVSLPTLWPNTAHQRALRLSQRLWAPSKFSSPTHPAKPYAAWAVAAAGRRAGDRGRCL
jgi:hypothetical protein